MTHPSDLKYSKSHEWVRIADGVATIGMTDYAQGELGDITYLELPEAGTEISASEPFGVVESVKAASDIYAPVDGEVLEINDTAVAGPDVINKSPYDDAWLIKVKVGSDAAANLMDAEAYSKYLEEVAH
ncbi:MAG TPA: glycine cleavage system protein GcvH [Thermomicrobiales bacterium]|nr:glycine cleavage system protein GcvH [Thermomicrobiales bacterium]